MRSTENGARRMEHGEHADNVKETEAEARARQCQRNGMVDVLENKHVEVVVAHDRSPVRVGVVRVESLPDLHCDLRA